MPASRLGCGWLIMQTFCCWYSSSAAGCLSCGTILGFTPMFTDFFVLPVDMIVMLLGRRGRHVDKNRWLGTILEYDWCWINSSISRDPLTRRGHGPHSTVQGLALHAEFCNQTFLLQACTFVVSMLVMTWFVDSRAVLENCALLLQRWQNKALTYLLFDSTRPDVGPTRLVFQTKHE